MTYLDFEMIKTPVEELARVWGTVTDENDQPFLGALVRIAFPFANHAYTPHGTPGSNVAHFGPSGSGTDCKILYFPRDSFNFLIAMSLVPHGTAYTTTKHLKVCYNPHGASELLGFGKIRTRRQV